VEVNRVVVMVNVMTVKFYVMKEDLLCNSFPPVFDRILTDFWENFDRVQLEFGKDFL
jgi:hypothetical protein